MQSSDTLSVQMTYDLNLLFEALNDSELKLILQSNTYTRVQRNIDANTTLVLDRFPNSGNASCCFLRTANPNTSTIRFKLSGNYQLASCPSGGWILNSQDKMLPVYWIPQSPISRRIDSSGRILDEISTSITAIDIASNSLSIELSTYSNYLLDITIWRFTASDNIASTELGHLLTTEKQPVFLWTSQNVYTCPGDLSLYLIHGIVYTNRFVWPRKWKFCSELDAYGLYVWLNGLELATGKRLYRLFKLQILMSVISRQSLDGGWYHGEWTDLTESHFRFHNGALHLLISALEEDNNETTRNSLDQAASFISNHIDKTNLGPWYLHDTLEESVEGMNELWKQTGAKWLPSRTLGKSSTNKLILNTHLDTIIALQRYCEVTRNNQYVNQVESAYCTARVILMLKPAEMLYRLVYWCIGLTLLPLAEARSLPFPIRAIKRLTSYYLIPQLHRIKRIFPRFVMPGGLIERHLSPLHFNIQYHAVNTMDLARLQYSHFDKSLVTILDDAVAYIENNNILEYWSESKPRMYALVVWIDALYRICIMSRQTKHLTYLAKAIMTAKDNELGLPPVILGSETEIIRISEQTPCPSPTDTRLSVINLSCGDFIEILVINSTADDLELVWEKIIDKDLAWETSKGLYITSDSLPLVVPPRDWICGRQVN